MAKYYGIIKFFSKESYLEDFLNGKMYCNTPSFYRSSTLTGVSDIRENCRFSSYYVEENKISINGRELDSKELRFIVKNNDQSDSYLHCWYSLSIPDKDYDGKIHFLENIVEGIDRIKKEFGTDHYVLILYKDIPEFIKRLQLYSNEEVYAGYVKYVDDINLINLYNKHISYKYQKEFRITIGTCSIFAENPLIFKVVNGFKDISYVNASIKIIDEKTLDEVVLF